MDTRTTFLSATALLAAGTGLALAQPPTGTGNTYLARFENVEIRTVAEAVSSVTGKQVLLHPQVHGVVTLVSEQPLSASQLFSAFAQAVVLKGYVMEEAGGLVKVYPGKPKD